MAAVLGVVVVGGCADADDVEVEAGAAPSDLGGRQWVLMAEESTPDIDSERSVTFTLRDGVAAGTAPCNTYRADVEVDGTELAIGEIASTLRACEPSVEEAEARFLGALRSVTAAQAEGDRLVLSGFGDVRLVFTSYDAERLVLGAWSVVDVGTTEALVGVIDGTNPVLTFADDGSLTLTTGCNDLAADWELVGDRLTVGPVRQTRMACDEPAGVMEQETALGVALDRAERVEVTPNSLTLLDGQDRIALVAAAAPRGQ